MPDFVEELFFVGCAIVTNTELKRSVCLLFEGFFENKEKALHILRNVAESHYSSDHGWHIILNMDESNVIPPRAVEKRDHSIGQLTMDGVPGETFVFPDKDISKLN